MFRVVVWGHLSLISHGLLALAEDKQVCLTQPGWRSLRSIFLPHLRGEGAR